MKHKNIKVLLILLISLIVKVFGGSFSAVAPEGFAVYKESNSFRAVSPEHVVYRVRTCKNQPFAEFSFWREALPEQMKNAGYRVIKDSVLTVHKNKSLLLEMAAPIGSVDYSYLVMMMVKGEKILIAEAGGAFDELQRRKIAVISAFEKLELK